MIRLEAAKICARLRDLLHSGPLKGIVVHSGPRAIDLRVTSPGAFDSLAMVASREAFLGPRGAVVAGRVPVVEAGTLVTLFLDSGAEGEFYTPVAAAAPSTGLTLVLAETPGTWVAGLCFPPTPDRAQAGAFQFDHPIPDPALSALLPCRSRVESLLLSLSQSLVRTSESVYPDGPVAGAVAGVAACPVAGVAACPVAGVAACPVVTTAVGSTALRSAMRVSGFLEGLGRNLPDEELAGLARSIAGLGPGLTPAGDDLLAGVMLCGGAEALSGEMRRDCALISATAPFLAAETSWFSGKLLIEAGQGYFPEPALKLGKSIFTELEAGVEGMREYGRSSGPALVLGALWGLLVSLEGPRRPDGGFTKVIERIFSS